MADILDEVLSDKNEERKVFYFKKALPIVGAVTLLIVIFMVINSMRLASREKYNMEMGDTLVKSLDNLGSNPKVAIEGIQYLMDHAENHTKDVAVLQMIALNISQGELDAALDVIGKVAEGKDYLILTQTYAKLMWLSIILDSHKANIPENKAIIEKYFAVFENEDVPFYGSANIMQALYYQKTDKERALKIAQKIVSSKNVSPTIRDEARSVIANINM